MIPTLTINNSYCEFSNFPYIIVEAIRQSLTYTDQELVKKKHFLYKSLERAEAMGHGRKVGWYKKQIKELGPHKICWLRDNKFPTGHIYRIITLFKNRKFLDFKVIDKRERPIPDYIFRWHNTPLEMRYYQKEAVARSDQYERGVFEMAVGSGKTLLLANIIKNKGVNSLIVVPSLALVEQTYRVLTDYFGSRKVEKLNSAKVKSRKKFAPIRIINIQSLASLNKTGKINKLLSDVQLIAIDEFHHASSKSFTDLLNSIDHIYYRYGFTGTFLRNDSKTLDMHGVLSNKLYEYSPKKAVEDGYLTPVKYIVHQLSGAYKYNYHQEYKINYCDSPILRRKIEQIIRDQEKGKNVLVLVDRKEQSGIIISEHLEMAGIENTYISGDDKKEYMNDTIEKFNRKEINVLVATSVLGEGVDIFSTDVLILATGGKSPIKFIQSAGRAVRLNNGKDKAYIHDFLFKDTKYLAKHASTRKKLFEENFAGEVEIC